MKGQFQIIAHREKIEQIIADPKTPAKLRDQLKLHENLRAFADSITLFVGSMTDGRSFQPKLVPA